MENSAPAVETAATSLRRIRLLINLAFTFFAVIVIATIVPHLQPGQDDSKQYREGARNLVRVGDPYATTRPGDDSAIGYPNPPLLAYLLVPTLPLGEDGGRLAWFWLNLSAWVAFIWLSIGLAGPLWAQRYWGPLNAVLLLTPPVYLCLLFGQLGIMLALLLVASFALASRNQFAAGATLAFAAVIKLYPGLVGLYFLLRGPRRVVVWAAATSTVLLALPLLFHGLTPYRSYVEKVLLNNFYPYAAEFNVSLVGLWRRLLTATPRFTPLVDAPGLAIALTLLSAVVVLVICLRATKTPGELGRLLAFSLWFCATLLLSPINGIYNLSGLIFPALVIAYALQNYRSIALTIGYLVSTGLIFSLPQSWYDRWPGLGTMLTKGWGLLFLTPSLLGLCGYVAILAILARRHRRAAANGGMLHVGSAEPLR